MNDQNLKAIINQKVDKAERPVCSEAVEAFQMSHTLYLKDKCIVEELKEHMNGHNYNVLEEFEALKAALCTLPEKIISQIKPPQEVSFKLLLKNCNPEEEKEMSEELVRLFDTEIKDNSIELSDDDCTKVKDAVRSLVKRFKNKGVKCLKDACECAMTNSVDKYAQKPVLSKDPSETYAATNIHILNWCNITPQRIWKPNKGGLA
ncbi:hypothetical protein MAR_036235 [Mya arenaria]|uniref:Uncharacterized protein n=1 Tax=Mya arenaria TaxID=6604 RepID=A0ABY7EPW0_MYAAR|nr:hypothetical protein MAR_036235 [Mya arenaria]